MTPRLWHDGPAKTNRKQALFLKWGRRPHAPGIYRFRARMAPLRQAGQVSPG